MTIEKKVEKSLNVVTALYAVLLVFGLRQMAPALHGATVAYLDSKIDLFKLGVTGLTALSIMYLGLRLFWCVGNIERFIHEKVEKLNGDLPAGIARRVMLFDVPCLLFHSLLYYFLCDEFNRLIVTGKDGHLVNWNGGHFNRIIYLHILLLFVNAIWLSCLRTVGDKKAPERVWFWNNIIFVVLGLIFVSWNDLVDFTAAFHCLMPLSPVTILLICMCLFISNSAVDLWLSARTYLVGDTR